MSKAAAQLVVDVLNTKPNAVLGMATGSTPLGLYQELVRLYKAGQVDFSRVTTFNLDEYVGLPANHPQSYHYFMHEHFFQHVNIPRHNINIPSGTTSNYPAFCLWYEQRRRLAHLVVVSLDDDFHGFFSNRWASVSLQREQEDAVAHARRLGVARRLERDPPAVVRDHGIRRLVAFVVAPAGQAGEVAAVGLQRQLPDVDEA